MGAIVTLIGLLVAAAFVAFLAYRCYFRRQSPSPSLDTTTKEQPHPQAHPQAHLQAHPQVHPQPQAVEKPSSVSIDMSSTAPAVSASAAEEEQVPAVVQSHQQLQQAVSASAPTSPNTPYPLYDQQHHQQQQQQAPPVFKVPLELPTLPPSPPPANANANANANTDTNTNTNATPTMGPTPAHLPTDGPILPTSTPPPQLPILTAPPAAAPATSISTSSLLAVPAGAPSLMLTPPTLPSPIPSDPTGWPAPGLESFAHAWHAHPYIPGARTCRQPFISHSHDELAVSVGDRVVVTLVFSDGWGLGFRVGPNGLPLTNTHEGVFPLCVLQPEVGDDPLVALERDLIARQQKQMTEAATQQQQTEAPATYYVSLPRAVEGGSSGTLPKSSLARSVGADQQQAPPVKVVGENGDNHAFDLPPEIAVQVERGASLSRRRK